MRQCTPAVYGALHVTVQTGSWSSVPCLTSRWGTGWCLRTWVPTLLLHPPPLMVSKDLTFTTSCPGPPGESLSQTRTCGEVFKALKILNCNLSPFHLQAICAASLLRGPSSSSRGVLPVRRSSMLWPREQLGHAHQALPRPCGLRRVAERSNVPQLAMFFVFLTDWIDFSKLFTCLRPVT